MIKIIMTILLTTSIITTLTYAAKLAFAQTWQKKYLYTDKTIDWLLATTLIASLLAFTKIVHL